MAETSNQYVNINMQISKELWTRVKTLAAASGVTLRYFVPSLIAEAVEARKEAGVARRSKKSSLAFQVVSGLNTGK